MGRFPAESLKGWRFVQRMHGLSGGAELRKHAVARALRELPAEEVARLLAEVLELDRAGQEAASCVLGAMMAALEDAQLGRALTEQLAQLPPGGLRDEVVGLLASGPAWRTLDEDAAARADARNFPETLGMLKTKARTATDPDALARFALASNPSVVRNLLLNPRLTEPSVVRLAARRPARSEPLVEVWRSKWGARHSVRRALAFNPYLPPEVGVKLVPLLLRTDWQEVAADAGLHPSVRAEARTLLAAESQGPATPSEPKVLVLDPEG
ncbi:MAG: hypothetical protein ACLQIH_19755 [Myxococcaceae bacterium]